MERVDVVILGAGPEAMAAAWGAAEGGVRVALVSDRALPRKTRTRYEVPVGELESLGLDEGDVDRVADAHQLGDGPPTPLEGDARRAVVAGGTIDRSLVGLAKRAGAVVREGAEALHVDVDPDGWKLQLSQGEPIRARIVVVADGARSRVLGTLGVAQAQRFTASAAEVLSFFAATWVLDADDPRGRGPGRTVPAPGPLGQLAMIAGGGALTVAFGPVWRGVAQPDPEWPSPTRCGAEILIDGVRRRLGIDGPPASIEVEEFRLDTLPAPASFDGGLVVGAAAGHRPWSPLGAAGAMGRQGFRAGAAAAECVHAGDWRAAALAAALGPDAGEDARIAIRDLARAARETRAGASWRAPTRPAARA